MKEVGKRGETGGKKRKKGGREGDCEGEEK